MNAALEKVASQVLINADYSQSKILANAHYDLLPEYQKRGYLKAAFAHSIYKVQDPATNAVTVQLPVGEGAQYRLSSMVWSGNKTFSANDLSKFLQGRTGEPLNVVLLDENLGGLSKIYATRGYMLAHAEPKFTFDDTAHTVSAEIVVNEGDQFHMGQVQFAGVSPETAAALQKMWGLHSTDAYDSSYPNLFINEAA